MTTKRLRGPELDAAVRRFDPAPSSVLAPAEGERAAAILARTLATDDTDDPDDPASLAVPTRRSPQPRRALVAAVGIATAAAVAVLLVPGLIGEDRAYASWTPVPRALTTGEAELAAEFCATAFELTARSAGAPVLAESRGDWTYVLLRSAEAETACILPSDAAGRDPADVEGQYFGSSGAATPGPAVGAETVAEQVSAVGSMEEGLFAWTQGLVGKDVVAVTLTRAGGQVVEASVRNGRYAAWWPAGATAPGNPDLTEPHTLEATLRDGRVVAVPLDS